MSQIRGLFLHTYLVLVEEKREGGRGRGSMKREEGRKRRDVKSRSRGREGAFSHALFARALVSPHLLGFGQYNAYQFVQHKKLPIHMPRFQRHQALFWVVRLWISFFGH